MSIWCQYIRPGDAMACMGLVVVKFRRADYARSEPYADEEEGGASDARRIN
ncbi:MAG: hypothetical protein KGQ42_10945 [Alphaproteobacteria bacterium]|nr:hypothetical protein [Alphaproteobacteria bacterium]